MVQKALLGGMTPKEEKENQLIDQQQWANRKGIVIQMPPLNTALVEAH